MNIHELQQVIDQQSEWKIPGEKYLISINI